MTTHNPHVDAVRRHAAIAGQRPAIPDHLLRSATADCRAATGLLRDAYSCVEPHPDLADECARIGRAIKALHSRIEQRITPVGRQ